MPHRDDARPRRVRGTELSALCCVLLLSLVRPHPVAAADAAPRVSNATYRISVSSGGGYSVVLSGKSDPLYAGDLLVIHTDRLPTAYKISGNGKCEGKKSVLFWSKRVDCSVQIETTVAEVPLAVHFVKRVGGATHAIEGIGGVRAAGDRFFRVPEDGGLTFGTSNFGDLVDRLQRYAEANSAKVCGKCDMDEKQFKSVMPPVAAPEPDPPDSALRVTICSPLYPSPASPECSHK